MGFWKILAPAAAALAATGVLGQEDYGSDSTTLEIVLPHSIRRANIYHRDAMFGTPFTKNHEVMGSVYYVPGDACSESSYAEVPPLDNKSLPRIFLVNRGTCTFTQKARIAQAQGGSALIAIDDKCSNEHQAFWTANNVQCTYEVNSLPYMADDGNGNDVTIPAFHVTKYDGQFLKNCALEKVGGEGSPEYYRIDSVDKKCTKDTEIIVRATIFIPLVQSKVKWNLWLSAEQIPKDMDMLSLVATAIRKDTTFSPKYIVYKAADVNCIGISPTDRPCEDLCVYKEGSREGVCIFPSQQAEHKGSDIIKEAASQLCMFDQFKNPEDQVYWWDYLRVFAECLDGGSGNIPSCGASSVNEIASLSNLDKSVLEKCTKTELEDQTKLYPMTDEMFEKRVFTSSVVINEVRQDFGLNGMFVARELCSGFADPPKVCNCIPVENDETKLRVCLDAKCFEQDKSYNCPHTNTCVSDLSYCSASSSSGLGVFFLIILVATVVGGAAFVYHKRDRRHMQEHIRDIISEYVPLESFPTRNDGFASISGHGDNNDTVGVI